MTIPISNKLRFLLCPAAGFCTKIRTLQRLRQVRITNFLFLLNTVLLHPLASHPISPKPLQHSVLTPSAPLNKRSAPTLHFSQQNQPGALISINVLREGGRQQNKLKYLEWGAVPSRMSAFPGRGDVPALGTLCRAGNRAAPGPGGGSGALPLRRSGRSI